MVTVPAPPAVSTAKRFSYYGRRCDKLQLRWEGTSGKNAAYRLRIKTGCNYGEGVLIKVFITQLWFDETTQGREE